jgi:Mg-chelatase subunit ChlD
MSRLHRSVWSAGLAILAAVPLASRAAPVDRKALKPRVEVVFCLDTTGSMTNLIEGAKRKIWSICNQIAGGKPTPQLKVGLVAYRDRGDEYITKVIELTDDLDAVHGQLMRFVATGGGDTPESVNQALDDAVNKVSWSKDRRTLRIIFLVGDAPPHMDYNDDVKYPLTCKKACEKGIIINAIQCGTDADCMRHWKDIAAKAEGSYAAIPQEGGVLAIATPFDEKLARINAKLAGSTLVYGRAEVRRLGEAKAAAAGALPAPAAADRAGFSAKGGSVASYDLIDSVKDKKVKVEDIKEEDLPEELRKIPANERKAYLEKVEKKRDELRREARELDRQRTEYVQQELKKQGKKDKDSFDGQVLEMLRKQAKKFRIDF